MSGYTGDAKYVGPEKIVVAMDIGTTQSAVSFSYLYPDDITRVRMVTKWPGQPESVGSSKIPSIIAYRQGQCKACGPEALDYIDDSSYTVAKWFKLHLHPLSMKRSNLPPLYGISTGPTGFEIPTLPPSVSIEQVYTDFIKYLMKNVQTSFEQSIPNGAVVWRRLRDTLVLILTTPNGWDLAQQSVLRNAVISSGVLKSEKIHELLEFVTEGEASVHYALTYSQSKTWLTTGSTFAVVDAGGSTVDSTLYECKSTNPKVMLEEVCPSECIQAGGIFIDRAVESIFKQKLRGTLFGNDDCIADMVAAFESRTKRIFDGNQATCVVDFGSSRDTDRARGIIKGKLFLTGEETSSTFEDVIQRITNNCSTFFTGRNIKYLLLVGGFGESPYLQKKLNDLFGQQGVKVVTIEEPAKKAAVEGAMIWFIKQHVTARVAKATLGICGSTEYRPSSNDHLQRIALRYKGPDGEWMLPHFFHPFFTKGALIHSDFTVVVPLWRVSGSLDGVLGTSYKIEVWEGDGTPEWSSDVSGKPLPQFRTLCTLTADFSGLRPSLQAFNSPHGKYYSVMSKVAIRFGGTQLQARVQWEEDGKPREGPVAIIPNAAF